MRVVSLAGTWAGSAGVGAGAAILGWAMTTAVTAAEITARSTIKTVMVFPQGAEITRQAAVRIEPGDHVVILRDLPADLSTDSIRVEAATTGAMAIGAVDVRQFQLSELSDPAAAENARRMLQDELDRLNDQRVELQARINAANSQKQLMQNLANLPNRQAPVQGGAPDPDWGQIFGLIGERLVAADKVIIATQVEMRALDKKIADVQAKLNQQPDIDEGRTEVKVRVSASAAGDATFVVKYQVNDAGWAPLYEARLTTAGADKAAALKLDRLASIYQSTGEAWTDVALALSTTRPQAGTAAPELTPIAVDFKAPAKPEVAIRRKLRQAEESAADMEAGEPAAMAVAPVPVAASVQQAAITNAAFQAIYAIAGPQTIANGVGNKRVQIDAPEITPSLAWRATPKLDPAAYLYAKWTIAQDLLLLPGQVALFRDGVYTGQGSLPQLAAGETHELGFGRDDKIVVKYADLGRKQGQSGLISTSKTDNASFKVTVKNLHAVPVTVRVLDQIPVSANTEIKVQELPGSTAPTVTDVDDKRGVMAWDLPLAAGAEQAISIAYQVSWPNNKAIVYQPRYEPWPR